MSKTVKILLTLTAMAWIFLIASVLAPAQAQNARIRITRPSAQPVPPPLVAVIAVFPIMFMAIEANLCSFVAGSVAPDWPADRQKLALGNCPPRAAYRAG